MERKETGLGQLIRGYYLPYRGRAFWVIFYSVFQYSYRWLSPIFFGLLLDLTVSGVENRMHWFVVYGVVMCVMILCNPMGCTMKTVHRSHISRGVSRDLRVGICRQLQQLTLLYHDKHSVGRMQSKAIRDIDMVERIPSLVLEQMFDVVVQLLIVIGYVLYTEPPALLFFVVLAPMAVGIRWYFRTKIRRMAKKYRRSFEDMSAGMTDMMTMIPVTRAHGLEEYEISRVSGRIENVFMRGRKLDILVALMGASSWMLFTLFQVVFLLGAIYYCFSGRITAGNVVTFSAYFGTMCGSVMQIINMVPQMAQIGESAHSICEILNAPDSEENEGKEEVGEVEGRLTLEEIEYCYPDIDEMVINGISLEIASGESIAFVGPSGCGKTTMLMLLLGFLHPANGKIYLDGCDMSQLDTRSYRRNVGVVTQSIVFFSDTIAENVMYGNEEIPEEQVVEALKMANAWEFVEKLPEGIWTRMGEDGIKLSGGQQQRLAIARALVRDPRILILDEATSALDVESEILVQDALSHVMLNRTSVVVSHRLSTVRSCDRIVVMDEGRIVTIGTHDELMKSDNFYSRIVTTIS